MTLNLDSRVRGVVVMLSWVDMLQFRFKLDSQLRDVLTERGIDPDTWTFSMVFVWPTESDLLFTTMYDFRAMVLDQALLSDNTTSCPSKTKSCLKVPDMFNLIQETLQHLYNLYNAFIPILHTIYPHNRVLNHMYTNTFLHSVVVPIVWLAAVLLVILPCCYLMSCLIRHSEVIEKKDVPLGLMENSEVFTEGCPCAKRRKYNRKKF
jgi:hypothetical protein